MHCELTWVSSGTFKMQQSPAICNTARGAGHSFVQKFLEVPKVAGGMYTERKSSPSLGPGLRPCGSLSSQGVISPMERERPIGPLASLSLKC